MRMRGPSIEMQQQMEVLFQENEHLTREIAILRDTIKELELRIETQKQTLQARDESIKKLLEMLQNKGMGKESSGVLSLLFYEFPCCFREGRGATDVPADASDGTEAGSHTLYHFCCCLFIHI